MENRTCNNCKHYVRRVLKMNEPDTPRSCAIGNNAELEKWWEDNGNKTESQPLTQMPCFEETDLSKSANKLMEALNKMRELIEKTTPQGSKQK